MPCAGCVDHPRLEETHTEKAWRGKDIRSAACSYKVKRKTNDLSFREREKERERQWSKSSKILTTGESEYKGVLCSTWQFFYKSEIISKLII